MKLWKQVLILPWIMVRVLTAQFSYPVDSLLAADDIPVLRKVALLPIAGWQRLSYNSDLLNCQFSPSCSNYGAEAIREYGVIRGVAMSADRIVRCNPGAYHYHLQTGGTINPAGYLVDPLTQPDGASESRPLKAAMLSALLPGAGRIYSGRWFEGILGGFLTIYTGKTACAMADNNHPIRASLYGILFLAYYGGEIYGAWRIAKYYPPHEAGKSDD